jgi:AraC-like DNA-binding protein
MAFIYRVSTKPLSTCVDYLWLVDGYVQPHAREFVLPSASMSLVVDFDDQTTDAVRIYGARSYPLVLGTSQPLRLIAAHFKPGGGFPFAACPVSEVHNLQVPLTVFWPSETAELRERILQAQTDDERFHVLEGFLVRRLRLSRPYSAAVRYAIRQFQYADPIPSVGSVRDQIGISAQRFIEVFRTEVGLSPKMFARLARFRRALRCIDRRAGIDWADVAVAAGYFDQPHFIHDFRQFAGVTPSAYMRHRTSANHVRIPD